MDYRVACWIPLLAGALAWAQGFGSQSLHVAGVGPGSAHFGIERPATAVEPSCEVTNVSLSDVVLSEKAGADLILDARDRLMFERGHLPGALLFPPAEMERNFPLLEKRLRKAKGLIVYCGSGWCGGSGTVARFLQAKGLKNVRVFPGGWAEWTGAKLAVAAGAAGTRDTLHETRDAGHETRDRKMNSDPASGG